MRKLFVHVGPPKTGTSAIQSVMSHYSGTDVLYPHIGLWSDNSHHNLVFNHYEDKSRPERIVENSAAQMQQIAALARVHGGNLLISSEALYTKNPGSMIEALLGELQALADWSAELVVVCRDHYERAASIYNQVVKDPIHMERLGPDEYLAKTAAGLCYAPHLQRLLSYGYPISVLNYHPAKTFTRRFLKHLGIATAESIPDVRRNVSLGTPALIATLVANRVAASTEERAQFFSAIRKMGRIFTSAQGIFDASSIATSEALFGPDRTALLQQYHVEIPAPTIDASSAGFFLTPQQFSEIKGAISSLGERGNSLAAAAASFVRN